MSLPHENIDTDTDAADNTAETTVTMTSLVNTPSQLQPLATDKHQKWSTEIHHTINAKYESESEREQTGSSPTESLEEEV